MKITKFLFFIMLCFYSVIKISDKPYAFQNDVLDYKYLSSEMIRFHFIANSDSEFDQMVKNNIKDEVLGYLKENENLNGNKFENLNILNKNINNIEKICNDVLSKFKVNQSVKIKIGEKYFKERYYENYLVPEGIYDSFIVYIGDGAGKNFWSMLFSSIGFIHDRNKNVKLNTMFNLVSNNKKSIEVSNSKSNLQRIKISFKIVDVVKNIFQKIF